MRSHIIFSDMSLSVSSSSDSDSDSSSKSNCNNNSSKENIQPQENQCFKSQVLHLGRSVWGSNCTSIPTTLTEIERMTMSDMCHKRRLPNCYFEGALYLWLQIRTHYNCCEQCKKHQFCSRGRLREYLV